MRPSGLRGREIDDELELRWLHDWKIGRLFALEDAAGVDAGLTVGVSQASAITHQAAIVDKFAERIHHYHLAICSKPHDLGAAGHEERVGADNEGGYPLFVSGSKRRIDFAFGTRPENEKWPSSVASSNSFAINLDVDSRRFRVHNNGGISNSGIEIVPRAPQAATR